MTVLIVYDTPEEAAAGVLLGYNSVKLAERAPRISSGGIFNKNGIEKNYFRIDTTPQPIKKKKPPIWGTLFKFI
jgi:hypothetical protein